MKVAVDMTNMRFTHVHPDTDVLQDLVRLEGSQVADVLFESTDRQLFLSKLTTLELRLLYRNTIGQDPLPALDDLALRELLAQAVCAMTPRKVNPQELELQVHFAEEFYMRHPDSDVRYAYVQGAARPAVAAELFPLHGVVTPQQVQAAPVLALQQRVPHPAPNTPATPTPQPAPGVRVRRTGVKDVVWANADRMWSAAGSPMDKDTVLKLRIEMMKHLEENEGIPRTTSSNYLGAWMKEKLA